MRGADHQQKTILERRVKSAFAGNRLGGNLTFPGRRSRFSQTHERSVTTGGPKTIRQALRFGGQAYVQGNGLEGHDDGCERNFSDEKAPRYGKGIRRVAFSFQRVTVQGKQNH